MRVMMVCSRDESSTGGCQVEGRLCYSLSAHLAGMLLRLTSGREEVLSPALPKKEGRRKRGRVSLGALLDFFHLVRHTLESGVASYA